MGGIEALDGPAVDVLALSIIKVGLVSSRIVGFFLIAPIFSSRAVPRNIRAALIISLASVVALIVDTSDQEFFFKFTSFTKGKDTIQKVWSSVCRNIFWCILWYIGYLLRSTRLWSIRS